MNALKLDLIAPTVLVDIHRVDEQRGTAPKAATVTVGDTATYAEIAGSETLRPTVV